jgi:predicted KAP-like P-loop ATPase
MMQFAALLNKLLSFVELLIARWKKADAQKQRDQVERDPHGWFDTHFNGVSDTNNQTTSADQTNTKNTTE